MRNCEPAASRLKRIVDLVVVVPALILLCPVLAAVALFVLMMMGRPVLYRQLRPGLNEQLFSILKFRTMRDDFDSAGNPLPDAIRLTPLGSLLRTSSLDELPQLWNVLRGTMSLVGPRPLLRQYLDRYTSQQARRHEVLPGITGWAQVNGRNAISWEKKFALDVWYVDHRSLPLDMRILALTVRNVVGSAGISNPDHSTMPEFFGNDRIGDLK